MGGARWKANCGFLKHSKELRLSRQLLSLDLANERKSKKLKVKNPTLLTLSTSPTLSMPVTLVTLPKQEINVI